MWWVFRPITWSCTSDFFWPYQVEAFHASKPCLAMHFVSFNRHHPVSVERVDSWTLNIWKEKGNDKNNFISPRSQLGRFSFEYLSLCVNSNAFIRLMTELIRPILLLWNSTCLFNKNTHRNGNTDQKVIRNVQRIKFILLLRTNLFLVWFCSNWF